ncbi:hypothetical protein HGA13_21580 [Nocardia speluncae]|uniref:Uncharacterized protein n=1 Tax=Nocardia speluncae TaxID=419477 RepID=A0A846XI24_9NOCA|nr:hypothetical protein [Nocardia speluncae]NKY35642.1 hypothetical protein [Nocardia speluncae]
MHSSKILTRTVLGSVIAPLLIVGSGGVAAAEPAPAPAPAPGAVAPVAACMAPGDTIELRAGLGALLGTGSGAIAGLPVFFFGAIPFGIIGGVIGAMVGSTTYAQDAWRAPQGC